MDMTTDSSGFNRPIEIPNKSTFKINEVCALTGIKSYVLRFWESEFDEISPIPSSSGQKLYELKDIEAILIIKKLLFEDKLSVERARVEIKKLIPERKLIDNIYESPESSSLEEDSFYLSEESEDVEMDSEVSLGEILAETYSTKYDVKKLDPEVIQTLKDKFLTSNDSTLETLEKSTQAMSEAGSVEALSPKIVNTPRLTVRTINDTEFSKLLQARAKMQEVLRVLEGEVSV